MTKATKTKTKEGYPLHEIWHILACPQCNGSLGRNIHGATCNTCSLQFNYTESGSLDLRPQRQKTYELTVHLSPDFSSPPPADFPPLRENTQPEVDFSGIDVPHHLTREILSYFPRANGEDSFMLDLGCGRTIHRAVGKHAGFRYVGFDFSSPDAVILGDAHALPFAADTFEFVLSIAVLEHIRFPLLAMKEVRRVLKPGGRFIGTVSFLEPFHSESFYHHTHLGVLNTLDFGGLTIDHIAPSKQWTALTAQANMVLFPKMPRFLSRALVFPIHIIHRLWWKLLGCGYTWLSESNRLVSTAGSFAFVTHKE